MDTDRQVQNKITEVLVKPQPSLAEALFVIKEFLKDAGQPDFDIEFFINCNDHLVQTMRDPFLMQQYQPFFNGNGINLAYDKAHRHFLEKYDVYQYTLYEPNGVRRVYY